MYLVFLFYLLFQDFKLPYCVFQNFSFLVWQLLNIRNRHLYLVSFLLSLGYIENFDNLGKFIIVWLHIRMKDDSLAINFSKNQFKYLKIVFTFCFAKMNKKSKFQNILSFVSTFMNFYEMLTTSGLMKKEIIDNNAKIAVGE